MGKSTLIVNAKVINEGSIIERDIFIKNSRIENISTGIYITADEVIDASGKYLLPGLIDDQVHFREPGLTHKANIHSESQAAIAGGITSYMEMPNTIPQTTTQKYLADKYAIGSKNSLANYSFYMGATNNNIEEVLKTTPQNVCGIKIFMGSSTGNMLVNDEKTLDNIFSKVNTLIAAHCEDETTIRHNTEKLKQAYGKDIPIHFHAKIRSAEACYISSSMAVSLAKKHGTQLHVLHISTDKETDLFESGLDFNKKKITAEACVHHLWFNDEDYREKGALIKWNPSIKTRSDREGIWKALLEDRIDIVATDHAPHTLEEKNNYYFDAPSGGPAVQHSLVALLELYHQGYISLEKIVSKSSHKVADLFRIKNRGFIREGYFADLVLVDLNNPWKVNKGNILYKCGWSPFEGQTFQSRVLRTWVNGNMVYNNGQIIESTHGMRLIFDR